jgi:hypothetical protein
LLHTPKHRQTKRLLIPIKSLGWNAKLSIQPYTCGARGRDSDSKNRFAKPQKVDRTEQYATHSNVYKESADWYVWTGLDADRKHHIRGNLIHSDSSFTYQEILQTIAPNGDWLDPKVLVKTSNSCANHLIQCN